MHRNLLPFILVSLGYIMFLLATSIPLFEWQVSEISTDLPSTYKVNISPFPLTTRLGKSLDNSSYIGKVYVSKNKGICRYEDVRLVIRRLPNTETLERASVNFSEKYMPFLEEWILINIYLSGIYIWWVIIWHKRPIWDAIGLTTLAVFVFVLLTQIVRPFLWRVGPSFESLGTLDCDQGTAIFNVGLSKVHYETLIIFWAGILLELGAVGIMLRQIIKAVIERKKASN